MKIQGKSSGKFIAYTVITYRRKLAAPASKSTICLPPLIIPIFLTFNCRFQKGVSVHDPVSEKFVFIAIAN